MPIVHECTQGSSAWLQLRSGRPCASSFHKVITPKTRKRSAQLEQYARELAAERLLGRPLESFSSAAMTDGTEREAQAVASYELVHGVDTEPVGFVTTDDGRVGASPDRIWTGFKRLVECKNPKANTHIGYLLGEGPDEEYRCQLQGQMYVCEAPAVDIISCFPGLPDIVVTVPRDEQFITELRGHLNDLCEMVEIYMGKLASLGYIPPPPEEPEAEEADGDLDLSDTDISRIYAATQSNGMTGAAQ